MPEQFNPFAQTKSIEDVYNNTLLAKQVAGLDQIEAANPNMPTGAKVGLALRNVPQGLFNSAAVLPQMVLDRLMEMGGQASTALPDLSGIMSGLSGEYTPQGGPTSIPQTAATPVAPEASSIPQQFLPNQDGQSAQSAAADHKRHYDFITEFEAEIAGLPPIIQQRERAQAALAMQKQGAPSDLVSIYSQHGNAAPVVHQEFQAKMGEQKRKAEYESMKPEVRAEAEQAKMDSDLFNALRQQLLVSNKASDLEASNPELVKQKGGMWVTGWGSTPVKDIDAIQEYLRNFQNKLAQERRKTFASSGKPKASDVAQKYGTLAGKK